MKRFIHDSTNEYKMSNKKDIEILMKAAVDVQTMEDLIDVFSGLLSYDKELYKHYVKLSRSGEYSPAAIGKMISDELYADYLYWYKKM